MHLCWKPNRHGRWRVYEQKCDTCILVKTPSFKCSVWPFSCDVCLNGCFEAGLLFQDGGIKSTAKMYFCRPTWKLASPWFPQQKTNMIFTLAFGLLQKINSVTKFMILFIMIIWKTFTFFYEHLLNVGYKQTTPQSHDFNITINKLLTTFFSL